MLRATTACTVLTAQLLRVLRSSSVLYILTWTCGVHFFDSSTLKSGPKLKCFVHFDVEMCFAPQRCAIFHLSSGQLAPHPPLVSLLFDPSQLQIIAKSSESRLSYLFAHLHLTLSFLSSSRFSASPLRLFPPLFFHLSILSEV